MKHLLLSIIFLASGKMAVAQDFITVWDKINPSSSPTSITFGVGTTGVVSYTWETIPEGATGSGTFSGTTATITGLPVGAIVRLKIDATNFDRIDMSNSNNHQRLIDVEQWGAVKWTSMAFSFYYCENLNISATDLPDLTLVRSMASMFTYCSKLNSPLNINDWNTSNVTDLSNMFDYATSFNQPIGNWNTSNVTDMTSMFYNANSFNKPIGNWNTGNVITMSSMFSLAKSFNQPIGDWNTSNVTDMNDMFHNAVRFNQPIENWNTSKVASMNHMFHDANSFNQPLNKWDTHSLLAMNQMFGNATSFNQPLNNWDVSNVSRMVYLFAGAKSFNQPLNNWNVSNVNSMYGIFYVATSFNQPLNTWNVSKVDRFDEMFYYATSFNQSLGDWKLSDQSYLKNMLDNCGMDCNSYSSTLQGWSENSNLPSALFLTLTNLEYNTQGKEARDFLIKEKNWTISGDKFTTLPCYSAYTDETNITVYPNPATEVLYLVFNNTKHNQQRIQFYNILGVLQYSTSLKENQTKFTMDVSRFTKGVYILTYEDKVQKILIE